MASVSLCKFEDERITSMVVLGIPYWVIEKYLCCRYLMDQTAQGSLGLSCISFIKKLSVIYRMRPFQL